MSFLSIHSIHLDKLKQLSRIFDPLYRPVIKDDGTNPSYVDEVHRDFREQLEASLFIDDRAKLLIAGQPGCGKTVLRASTIERVAGVCSGSYPIISRSE